MLFTQIVYSALVMGSAISASHLINERFVDDGFNALTKRQQFVPTTQTAAGDTCAAAFGAGYETCREKTDSKNRLCYNPTAGQTCCSATWACPNGSFCLVDPYCCPNGSDPKTCAADNGVSISSDFATPVPSAAPKSIAHNTTSSSVSVTAAFYKPYPTAANATTVVKPTGTGHGGYATSPVVFPGAANTNTLNLGLAAAGILGFIATIF
jgi:hypothetical protein